MLDLEDLSDRLRQTPLKYVRLNRAEREFLAELIQAYIRSRGRKEIAGQKAVAVAQHVIWLEEFWGFKTEAAIADAEQRFGLKRSRVTEILKEQRPKWDSLRSAARSDAVRQAYYTLIEEQRAFDDDIKDSPASQTYARLLEDVTELAMLEKKDEAMQEELAALGPDRYLATLSAGKAELVGVRRNVF
jgi:hypothetical protein